ncbi:restriction endonuclease subunit S [Myroides marinus]|uniref:restriction endonuclease subunit S n=1 Tax=Myroides marinus TaxID=703342 RepID=UPI002578C6CB|nr:restriction endonuclease subunit S [Myroides marinus]MDM1368332.1 restriction endonuclease subunit S [Myroides marinus]MDM1390316.1 restriction endonuclease subunit S [Myroides marinus]
MKKLIPVLRFPEFKGEWEEKKLRDIAEKIGDGLHSTPIYNTTGNYFFINGNNLVNSKIKIDYVLTKRVNKSEYEKYKKELTKSTILMSINGTIGSLALYEEEEVILGKSVGYINVNKKVIREFLFFLMQNERIKKYFLTSVTGTTIKNLGLKVISQAIVDFPSLPEQTKIADFLTQVDEQISLLTEKVAQLQLYKKGVMQKLFSQELRFKDENGKDYPKWEEKKLGEVADITKLAGYEFTKHIIYQDQGEIIALRALNIKNGGILLNDVKYIDNSDLDKLNRSKLVLGDILFTYVGTIGEVAIINENDKYYLAPNVARIRLSGDILPHFMMGIIRNDEFKRNEIDKYIATSSQPALSMTNIRKFKLNIPSLPEQTKIANFLTAIDEQITGVEQQLEQSRVFKKGLLQGMFV